MAREKQGFVKGDFSDQYEGEVKNVQDSLGSIYWIDSVEDLRVMGADRFRAKVVLLVP